jgi:hypothetical protein
VERYFNCQLVCDFCPKKHIFNCLKTKKEINDFIENLRRIDYEFTVTYNDIHNNGGVYSQRSA